MGVIIQDKSANYSEQFDAIISAADDAIAVCYFGDSSVPEAIRLGEYNATGNVGSIVPTGAGAVLLDDGGVQTEKDSGTSNPSRFVYSWKNTSAKCALLVVAHIAAGGGIASFAGARIRLNNNRVMGVLAVDGTSRESSDATPDEAVCFFLNSNESSYQNGLITSSGAITRVTYSGSDISFTKSDATCYIGGVGYSMSGFPGPNTFYSAAAFDRFLTDDELIAQAQQLIRYANTIGAEVA